MNKFLLWKIFWRHFLIFFFLFPLFAYFLTSYTRKAYMQSVRAGLQEQAITAGELLIPLLVRGDETAIQTALGEIGKKLSVRLSLIRSDGVVVGDSDQNPREMENQADRSEIRQAFQGQIGYSTRYSTTVHRIMLYVAVPIFVPEKGNWVIRSALPLTDISRFATSFSLLVYASAFLLTCFSALLVYWANRSVARSVRGILNTLKQMEGGNFFVRIPISTSDELGQISSAINTMAERVETQYLSVEEERKVLLGLLSAIKTSILLLNRKGEVLFMNPSFHEEFHALPIEAQKGNYFWEILRYPSLISALREVISSIQPLMKIIDVVEPDSTRAFLLTASPVSIKEQALVVSLHNITPLRELQKVKEDFVSNVSHELRSPLTSILGYLEVLREDSSLPEEKARRFLEIAYQHAQWMHRLVENLLLLSRMESEKVLLNEKVQIAELLQETLEIHRREAEAKDVKIQLEKPEELPTLQGDPVYLRVALSNLVENAIKFNQPGGKVVITVCQEDGNLIIKVSDTGIGISKTEQKRIFERFYTVDKSRSSRGTGLGLSIAKHAVLAHNGSISVESMPGIGSTFTISLPISR